LGKGMASSLSLEEYVMSNPYVASERPELKKRNENEINVAVLPFLPMLGNFLKCSVMCTL
jgi:hypothetical protein